MKGSWGGSTVRPVALAAISCALLCVVSLYAQGAVVARASSVTGTALLTTPGAAAMTLTPGYILAPGDRIDTRGGGRVIIDLSDGSMVVVAPESLVVLKDYRTASSLRELFEITLGTVRVKINHFAGKPNPYRMNSPTASIAVRGTEFTIDVGVRGETQVAVIEGLVEVAALSDPSRSVLLESGRSVLVQLGQDLRLIGANQPPPPQPGNRDGNDRGGPPMNRDGHPGQQAAAQAQPPGNRGPGQKGPPQPEPREQSAGAGPGPGPGYMAKNDPDRTDQSPRSTASTYDRYLAGLTDIGQVPFLLRFNAFSESHLDSLENPAYASQFQAPEGRFLFLPTFRGTRTLGEYQSAFGPGGTLPAGYSISPQFSFFAPAGRFTFGGAGSFSRIGDDTGQNGSSTSNFYSGALVGAMRAGANSFGAELATLRGSGSVSNDSVRGGFDPPGSTSEVTQTRLTAGYARNLTSTATLGLFTRYAFIHATDRAGMPAFGNRADGFDNTSTAGHSIETGMRLRGMLTPRLYYGVTAAWLGIGLRNTLLSGRPAGLQGRDRAQRGSLAMGLGYALTDRTVFTFDLAGGTGRTSADRSEDSSGRLLQNGLDRSRFASLHAAVQRDLTRRLFASASLLQVWQSHRLNVDVFTDRYGPAMLPSDGFFPFTGISPYASRFSDFGVGWRFTRDLYTQYVYSTDYGVTSATHTLMLRWTFRPKR